MAKLWALRLLVHVGGRLPVRPLDALARAGAALAWWGSPRLRRVTRGHMRHVLGAGARRGDVDRAARGCVLAAARYYTDFARYAHLAPERAFAAFEEIAGLDLLFERIDRGRGVVLVSAHLGNPEFIMQAAGVFEFPSVIVTERLEPPSVHALVERVRGRSGVRFVAADRAGLRALLASLRCGGVAGVMSDRDVLGTGRPTPFFGDLAPLPTAAVDLARATGAPMVLGTVLRTRPGRFRLRLEPVPLPPATGDRERDLDAGMRALAAALEGAIRAAPEQWFALSPIWPEAG